MTHNDIWTNKFMITAMEQACLAASVGEVPVGAVVVKGDRIISAAHNLCERNNNPLLHAEILAIERAVNVLGDMRLDGCDMYVTLEPCVMCCGAISHARLNRLYFGAYDRRAGAVVSNMHCFDKPSPLFKVEYYCGIMEEQCTKVLTDFFKSVRDGGSQGGQAGESSIKGFAHN